jgi:hypothetical protein
MRILRLPVAAHARMQQTLLSSSGVDTGLLRSYLNDRCANSLINIYNKHRLIGPGAYSHARRSSNDRIDTFHPTTMMDDSLTFIISQHFSIVR